jgi:1-deoxy-D-xylulose-5-phosphate reductoisomerase
VVALAAYSNIERLTAQIKEFKPKLVAVYDQASAESLRRQFPEMPIYSGLEGLIAVAEHPPAEMVLSAILGTKGLEPTFAAITAKKNVALANKEVLVSAGDLVMRRVKEKQVKLLPVDSEHSALFQCLQGNQSSQVRKLILTASGGPCFFRERYTNLNLTSQKKKRS